MLAVQSRSPSHSHPHPHPHSRSRPRPPPPLRLASSILTASSLLVCSSLLCCEALASPVLPEKRTANPVNIHLDPAPAAEDGPPLSAGALRDNSYLPIQIGAIAGAYGASLVVVAVLLFFLSKKRRKALSAGDDETDFAEPSTEPKPAPPSLTIVPPQSPRNVPRSPVRNFSYPSPDRAEFAEFFPSPSSQTPYVAPSPSSSVAAPGIDFSVDQRIVAADRNMAQAQLEEMYKYVLEQDEAKQQGIILQGQPTLSTNSRSSTSDQSTASSSRREKTKPAHLKLSKESPEERGQTQSRTSSILSALRSPKKKNGIRGVSISSPLMTPSSATFPAGQESQEMNTIPPRHYAPAPPPPVPMNQMPFGLQRQSGAPVSPITPDRSPESTQSIDERIGGQLTLGHTRNISNAPTEGDPYSASSENSTTPLVGLPSSPKASVTSFPSLPSSPKPGSSFQRPNAPSAVRTGGALPLRAYEPSVASPSAMTHTTKQTVFERTGPLSPMSARTPATGAAVPYSPYQPFTPCVPMTPSLVTKADRKRMRKLEPKTPTMELVRDNTDVW